MKVQQLRHMQQGTCATMASLPHGLPRASLSCPAPPAWQPQYHFIVVFLVIPFVCVLCFYELKYVSLHFLLLSNIIVGHFHLQYLPNFLNVEEIIY